MSKKKQSTKGVQDGGKISFEEAIRVLTEIVEKIETGQVPLEESLVQYEKGMALIGQCRRILQDAEKRIAEIEQRHGSDSEGREPEEESEEEDSEEDKEEGLF
jgi:exodeoxyribonuclease VII small subunit